MIIRNVLNSDIPQVVEILNHYVRNDSCTFQINTYSISEISEKIAEITKVYPYIVMEEGNEVIGFAYASRWREKNAYDKSAETTIYLNPKHKYRGLGKILYQELIEQLREKNFRLLVACLTLPNPSSVRLHESLGFEKVGEFKDAGYKFNRWYNVGFWQKVLK
ncbi:MAG: N-acetyltransferase family protein [Gammaproteobacteria bacterium]|jgi:phosphinothricin acetyltransferase